MFFVFEGGDGCGKSTQARLLKEYLETELQLPVLAVREPGGTALGEELRRILLTPREDDLAAETELYLFMAARAHLVRQRIVPALEQGMVVVSDRFLWSSAAYQGASASVAPTEVLRVGRLAVTGVNVTRTFLIDIDPEIALSRTSSADPDRMERRGVEFQRKVRENFLALAKSDPDRVTVVDGSGTPEQVHARVIADLPATLRSAPGPRE